VIAICYFLDGSAAVPLSMIRVIIGLFSSIMFLTAFSACPKSVAAQTAPFGSSLAKTYFLEAEGACDRDGGRTWRLQICGPILFVDSATRRLIANRPDPEGLLKESDGVYVGELPKSQPIANYSIKWSGQKWAMIVWSTVPEDEFRRLKLIIHESFHRVQDELKLVAAGGNTDHLNTLDGRLWMQLEWRALRLALLTSGAARRRSVEDALTFRQYRYSLFPEGAIAEKAWEMHEGLAEYTAFRISAKNQDELTRNLVDYISNAPIARPSFVASFAYTSGAAYGVLLDRSKREWRKGLTSRSDLGVLLQRLMKIKPPPPTLSEATQRSEKYDGSALRAAEKAREEQLQARILVARKKFAEGPTLLIDRTSKGKLSFNSSNLLPIEALGTVYPVANAIDEWGNLSVTNGALMVFEEGRISKIYVSAVGIQLGKRPIEGDGWTLELTAGWGVVPDNQAGNYILKKIN
jgi:hypothetical protein